MKTFCAMISLTVFPAVAFAQLPEREGLKSSTVTEITAVPTAEIVAPIYPTYQTAVPTEAPVEENAEPTPFSEGPDPLGYMDPALYPTGPGDIDTVSIGDEVCEIQSVDRIESVADTDEAYSPRETLKSDLTISCLVQPPPAPVPGVFPTTCDPQDLQSQKFSIVYDKSKGTVSEQLSKSYREFAWNDCEIWSGNFCKIVVPGFVDRAKAPCMFKEWKYDPEKFAKGEKNEGKIKVIEMPKGTFNLNVKKICYFECKDCKIPGPVAVPAPKT